MGDLRHCSEQEVEDIVSGIKAALVGQAPKGPLEDDLKKAGKMIEERKDKKAKETAAAGKKGSPSCSQRGRREEDEQRSRHVVVGRRLRRIANCRRHCRSAL